MIQCHFGALVRSSAISLAATAILFLNISVAQAQKKLSDTRRRRVRPH